jgi:hypothetical protein
MRNFKRVSNAKARLSGQGLQTDTANPLACRRD